MIDISLVAIQSLNPVQNISLSSKLNTKMRQKVKHKHRKQETRRMIFHSVPGRVRIWDIKPSLHLKRQRNKQQTQNNVKQAKEKKAERLSKGINIRLQTVQTDKAKSYQTLTPMSSFVLIHL